MKAISLLPYRLHHILYRKFAICYLFVQSTHDATIAQLVERRSCKPVGHRFKPDWWLHLNRDDTIYIITEIWVSSQSGQMGRTSKSFASSWGFDPPSPTICYHQKNSHVRESFWIVHSGFPYSGETPPPQTTIWKSKILSFEVFFLFEIFERCP